MTFKDDLFNVKRALNMKDGRRRKRTLYEALSPNVNYDNQGQPWLPKDDEECDEYDDQYEGMGHDAEDF